MNPDSKSKKSSFKAKRASKMLRVQIVKKGDRVVSLACNWKICDSLRVKLETGRKFEHVLALEGLVTVDPSD
jgi:hypothetical protein